MAGKVPYTDEFSTNSAQRPKILVIWETIFIRNATYSGTLILSVPELVIGARGMENTIGNGFGDGYI